MYRGKRNGMTLKAWKKAKGSSTAGTSKGNNCKKTELKTRLSKDNRFYRTDPKGYTSAIEQANRHAAKK